MNFDEITGHILSGVFFHYTADGALRVREKETSITSSYKEVKWDVFTYGYNGLLKTFGSSSWSGSSINCARDTNAPPQWQWEYRYSAGGERESKRMVAAPLDDHSTISHLWTYYLLSGNKQQLAVYNGRETSETDACFNTTHRVHFYPTEYLTYGVGTSALITTRPNQFREYKIVDHLGSTRVVLDSNAAVLGTYDYEPFGKPLAKTGLDSRKSFIDREKDKESALNNLGARSFDDGNGIFTSIDPIWETFRSWSPYHYSYDNPLNYQDPSGFGPFSDWLVRFLSTESGSGGPMGATFRNSSGAGERKDELSGFNADKARLMEKSIETSKPSEVPKTYQTYTKTNPTTGEVYSGRTSGKATPRQNVTNRDNGHHMNNKGFDPAKLDKSSTNKDVIRGREQQLIDKNGGAKSQGGTSGNPINGVSPNNPKAQTYNKAALKEFGKP